MSNQQLYRLAALLVSIAALFLIFERLWSLGLIFQDIILLFALAWLIAFTLAPVIEWLKRPFWPKFLYDRFYARIPPLPERRFMPHGGAVAVVYLAMVLALIVATGSLVPVALDQGQKLSQIVPELPNRLPTLMTDLERELSKVGVNLDLPGLYQSNIAPSLKDVAANAFREFLGALSVVASTVSNLMLVVILSLYMNLGGSDLANQLAILIPRKYKEEVLIFALNVNKNFGGFVRGQLLQALLAGIATAVVMLAMRLDFVVLGAVLSGMLMLIPLLGVILTIIPPVLIAIFLGSFTTALVVFALLFAFQQVLMNVVMPKILAESVGLHPLLVFGALLVGARVGGIWGAFFGIPIAGVLYAMLIYFGRRLRRAIEESAKQA